MRFALAATLALATAAAAQTPAGNAFTYQGELKSSGQVVSGPYDFQFTLYDGPTISAAQVGPVNTRPGVSVSQGRFSARLDFGAAVFNSDQRFLAIAVRPAGSGSYTILSPRQELTPVPYAQSLALPLAAQGNTEANLFFPSGLLTITQTGSAAAVLGVSTEDGSGLYGYAPGGGTAVTANSPGGTALRLTGAIRVTGAGVNTPTPAFIHLVTPTNIGGGHSTFISNAACNGDPNVIMLVTYNVEGTGVFSPHPVGVSYDPSSGFWWISNLDSAPMVAGAKYNVLVIKN
jgi:hypothetical protein